jgi:hypothetical protein
VEDRSKRKFAVDFVQTAFQLRGKCPAAAFFLAEDRFSAVLIRCAEEISSPTLNGAEDNDCIESDWAILKAALAAAASGSEPGMLQENILEKDDQFSNRQIHCTVVHEFARWYMNM